MDPKSGEEKKVTISEDDGIRPETTMADLAKLKAVFKKSGSTTAGMLHNKRDWYLLLCKFSIMVFECCRRLIANQCTIGLSVR